MAERICPFERKLLSDIKKYSLFPSGATVTVALSGGIDSTVLLTAIKAVSGIYGIKITAAHLNHMLRGEEADRDERFCIELCNSLNIPIVTERINVQAQAAKDKKSFEETARKIRYDFLYKSAVLLNSDYILTAHNANDNAETIIFNLIRGTALKGLAGIPRVRDIIVRPLLSFQREDIERYAEAKALRWVNDSTNSSLDYSRNFIRNVIIPDMKQLNPAVIKSINRMSACIIEDDARISKLLSDYSVLSSCQLSKIHLDSMISAMNGKKSGYLSLPDAVTFKYNHGEYGFYKASELISLTFPEKKLSYGLNVINDWLSVNISDSEESNAEFTFQAPAELLENGLYVRPRKEGDKIRINHMSKSIKKAFIDKKIPKEKRKMIPIIGDKDGPVYVPFIGKADRTNLMEHQAPIYISINLKGYFSN